MSDPMEFQNVLTLSAQIVSAHVKNNPVGADGLPSLIRTVYETLVNIDAVPEPVVRQEPAVAIKKSVFPTYIICLEDGKRLKMLKRHLATSYGLTPGEYRAKWGLPMDYPMTAPDYAVRRSELAKQHGLGRKSPIAADTEPVMARPAAAVYPERQSGLKKAGNLKFEKPDRRVA
jgi:predicted transcriptional regulator